MTPSERLRTLAGSKPEDVEKLIAELGAHADGFDDLALRTDLIGPDAVHHLMVAQRVMVRAATALEVLVTERGSEPVLPVDVQVAHITFRKGVKLSTFVSAATRWHTRAAEAALARTRAGVETSPEGVER